MTRIITNTLIFLLCSSNIIAQSTFQTVFSQQYDTTWSNSNTAIKKGNCAIYSFVEVNGSYYTVGQDDWIDKLIGNSSAYTVHGGYFGSITKVSSNGNKVWSKVDLNSKYLNKVIRSSDDKLITAGRSNDGCWTVCKVGKATISKIDTNGNVVWSKGYNGSGGFVDDFLDVVECKNKDYLAVGYTDDSSQSEQGLISRLDSNGQVLWTKLYGSLGRVTQIQELKGSSNCIIISNRKTAKIDKHGNAVASFKSVVADNVIQLQNGKLMYTSFLQTSGTYTQRDIRVTLTDTTGNVLGGYTYTIPNFTFAYVHQARIKKDGTVLLACYAMDQSTSGNVADTYSNMILNIDQNANVIWAKEYHYDEHLAANEHYDMLESSDNAIVFAGSYLNIGSISSPSVISKIDSSGVSTCLNSSSLLVSRSTISVSNAFPLNTASQSVQMGTYYSSWRNNDQVLATPTCGINPTLDLEDDFAIENNGATVFPNPSSGEFTISFNKTPNARIIITDMLGNVVKSIEQVRSNSYTYNSGDLSKGLYFVNVYYRGSEKQVIRVIKN